MDPIVQLRVEITERLTRIEDKIDALREDMGDHAHAGNVTWPWFIGTVITITAIVVGLLV